MTHPGAHDVRMARPQRIDFEGDIHHVILKGVDGQPIFFGDRDRLQIGRLLAEIHEMYAISTIAYCLMTNHLHLIVYCPEAGLSLGMKRVGESLAVSVNRRTGREGHLFGSRFYSSVIDTDRYLLCGVRYVERNSLDLPGVDRPGDHRWSSFRANAGLKEGPTWLDSGRILGYFSGTAQYRAFVERDLHTREPEIEFDDIDQLVGLIISMQPTENITPRQSTFIKTLLLGELGDSNRARLLAHLGFPSPRAEATAIDRAQHLLDTRPAAAEVLAELRAQLFDIWGADLPDRRVPPFRPAA